MTNKCVRGRGLQLGRDGRGRAGRAGRGHSCGRMSQGLQCPKQHGNEYTQGSVSRGLEFWVVARSNRDEKQESNWACGSKKTFGEQVPVLLGRLV